MTSAVVLSASSVCSAAGALEMLEAGTDRGQRKRVAHKGSGIEGHSGLREGVVAELPGPPSRASM